MNSLHLALGHLFLVALVSSTPLTAQQEAGLQRKERHSGVQEPLRTAQATRVEQAPKLDGSLDDPLWQHASPISDFLQREPFEGQHSTEKTEVRILYTKHEVYFGIKCSDSQPGRIIATELRRDVPQELDDYFEIIIDSSYDRRNAYVFQINPLGAQRDALITEEQPPTRVEAMAILVGTACGPPKHESPKRDGQQQSASHFLHLTLWSRTM